MPAAQLGLACVAMICVASVQEGWALFVTAFQQRLGGGPGALVQVSTAFSAFVCCQTAAVPLSGHVADRHSPQATLIPAALLFGGGWYMAARAESLAALSLSFGVAAVGVGTVYATTTAHAIRWFPHRRGLAAGLTSSGYGAGAALFIASIQRDVDEHGAGVTIERWSMRLGSAVLLAALLMRPPPAGHQQGLRKAVPELSAAAGLSPGEMVRTELFRWCFLVMMLIKTFKSRPKPLILAP